MKRTLTSIVPTHTVTEGGGFRVRRPVAMGRLMSPFLLLDEMLEAGRDLYKHIAEIKENRRAEQEEAGRAEQVHKRPRMSRLRVTQPW